MTKPCDSAKTWSRPVRVVVSILLLWHFSALVVAAWAALPSAPIIQRSWTIFRPYLQSLYLNHAYRYYSPEPGPTMVMQYELTWSDGQRETKLFPHRDDYGPRLQYQRRLALTNALAGPKRIARQWAKSYARYLCRTTGAERVVVSRVLHMPMSQKAALDGADPTAPESYVPPDRLGAWRCSQF